MDIQDNVPGRQPQWQPVPQGQAQPPRQRPGWVPFAILAMVLLVLGKCGSAAVSTINMNTGPSTSISDSVESNDEVAPLDNADSAADSMDENLGQQVNQNTGKELGRELRKTSDQLTEFGRGVVEGFREARE